MSAVAEIDLWGEWAGCKSAADSIASEYHDYVQECEDDKVEPSPYRILSITALHGHYAARHRAADEKLTAEQRRRFVAAFSGPARSGCKTPPPALD